MLQIALRILGNLDPMSKLYIRKRYFLYLGMLFFIHNLYCQNIISREHGEVFSSDLNQIPFLSFNSQDTERAVLKLIGDARESIAISLYGLENEAITEALIEAYHLRGVNVRLSSEFDSASSPSWQKLVRYGLPVRFGNAGGIMHNKYMVIDRKYVLTGSTNLTKGLHKNYNHTLVLKSPSLAREYLQDFEIQVAGYYGTTKDEAYDRIIGGLEEESHELHWDMQKHNFGTSTVRAYFTPYKDSFPEYTSNPGDLIEGREDLRLALCEETCLEAFSGSRGLCDDQDCTERACYRNSSRGRGKILYAYPNYDAEGKLYCSPYDNAMNTVLSFVRKARTSILVLAFAFRDRLLMHELIRAKEEKGIRVKVWIDRRQFQAGYKLSKGSFHSIAQRIDFLKICHPGEGLLHHKVIVIDERHLLLGSLNFSQNAVNVNDENFLIIEDAQGLAEDFYREAARIDPHCSVL